MQFSPDQATALRELSAPHNIFLTGRAGTGKSTVLKEFLRQTDPSSTAVLASTGAAAVLVGGRTFHSFFGLGILEGGRARTVERALKNPHLRRRLKATDTVIIDEVSMLSGETLATAEEIARSARRNDEPWGNIRIIAVGDFAQLPPVTRNGAPTDWAFTHEVWQSSRFHAFGLETMHRTSSLPWNDVLNRIRDGHCDEVVRQALRARTLPAKPDEDVTRLFGLRRDAEEYNSRRLDALPATVVAYPTKFLGTPAAIEQLKRNAPVPELLLLKTDALVMIRKNETNGLYVNGSIGHVRSCREDAVCVELLESGLTVELEPMKFEMLDAEGEVVATAKNFPLNLAYGSTIHKSQGATLDGLRLRLANLWESGQAYVALSRVRDPERLYLDGWDEKSIRCDALVRQFHANLHSQPPPASDTLFPFHPSP